MKSSYSPKAIKAIEQSIKRFKAAGIPLAIAELAAIRAYEQHQQPCFSKSPAGSFLFASTPEPKFWYAVMANINPRIWG